MIYHELYAFELRLKRIIDKYPSLTKSYEINNEINENIKKELNEIFIYHSENSITYTIDDLEIRLTGFSFHFEYGGLTIIPGWGVV
jgi:hypothetical protein